MTTIAEVLQAQNKSCGAGTVAWGTELKRDPPRLPTGVFAVDFACYAAGTEIQSALDGSLHLIEDVVERQTQLEVPSLKRGYDKSRGSHPSDYELRTVTGWVSKGHAPCICVKTKFGSKVVVAEDHVFKTAAAPGWAKAVDLEVGDELVKPIAYRWPFGDNRMEDSYLKFLGYWVSEGDGSEDHVPRISNTNPEIIADLKESVEEKGYFLTGPEGISYSVIGAPALRDWRGRFVETHIFRGMLKELGLWGKNAPQKFIPGVIFTQRRKQIMLFLSRLFMGDGSVAKNRRSVTYATTSRQLAYQVKFLLLRIGIAAYIIEVPPRESTFPGGRSYLCRRAYQVFATGYQNLKVFHENIPLFGEKYLRLKSWVSEGPTPVRKNHRRFIYGLDSVCDHVTSLENVGLKEVFDLTVPPLHNFVVGDLVHHNSGGGLPIWGSTCFWGKECIFRYLEVMVMTSTDGKMHSRKKTTIENLYNRFNRIVGGKGKYPRKESLDADYFVQAVDENEIVFFNRVQNVVKCGEKECYKVTLKSGKHTITTLSHEYYVGNGEFKKLQALAVGDTLYSQQNVFYKGEHIPGPYRQQIEVKYHPTWKVKVDGRRGSVSYRDSVYRAVYEAVMNDYTYEEYIALLNDPEEAERVDLWTIPEGFEIHHKDFDPENNDQSNLQLIEVSEHRKIHFNLCDRTKKFVVVEDEIVSIDYYGKEMTYDIQCYYPYNNYVANGIVVHNSGGKTSLALNVVKMAQLMCWRCYNHFELCSCSESPLRMMVYWGDVEGTLDRDWAEKIGVQSDKYTVGLADYGEQHVNVADSMLKADDCGLIVIDSLAALVPSLEMDTAEEGKLIGQQALMITRMVRKLKQRLIMERKREKPCAILFTNQLRLKINLRNPKANPESMSGGMGMFHEFSLLLRIVSKALQKEGVDKKYMGKSQDFAVRHSFAVRKAKVLTMSRQGEFVRLTKTKREIGAVVGSVADETLVMNYAREYDIVKKDRGKWQYLSNRSSTLDAFKTLWRENFEEYMKVVKRIIDAAKKRLAAS